MGAVWAKGRIGRSVGRCLPRQKPADWREVAAEDAADAPEDPTDVAAAVEQEEQRSRGGGEQESRE